MKIETELPRRIERYIADHHLLERSGTLLVGVSGGADSICLLHNLISLQDTFGLDLHVAHLDHQLRGIESEADAAYVTDLAGKLGIEATVEERDVREYQAERRCSLEEAAREVRYAFFAEVAERIDAGAVAVGHTADDQAETIIMHLIRGTGLSGLQGMRPLFKWGLPGRRALTVIRPLLEVTRQQTQSYCGALEIHPRIDSSNLSPEYLRNRIRAEIMPRLAEFNPNIVESLTRTARIIAEDIEHLDGEVKRIFDSVVEEVPYGIALDNRAFSGLSLALGRRLLRSVLGQIVGSLRDIELVHIESIMEVLRQPAGKELSLPYGLTFYGDYEKSFITRGENPLSILPPLEGETRLQIPGETIVSGWRVKAEVLVGKPETIEKGDFVAFFDLDLSGGKLIVRSRRDGDRFQPLGMEDSKKLQDFMVDSKIPRSWRDQVPLVCAGERIIWVMGWRIDHRTRVTDFTQRTLRLEFEME
jgi:tRNA(Ile)-lysidine synthase